MENFGQSERVRRHLNSLKQAPRVTVLGDVMLDRYLHGDTDRISPEAPVPVLRVKRESAVAGGAANVALNLARLGAETTLIGFVGDDANAQKLRDLLAVDGIAVRCVVPSEGFPTITKTRVIGGHQQMLRVDQERPETIEPSAEARLLSELRAALDQGCDALVLSDYAKGVLSPSVCQAAISIARSKAVPTFVDPKGMDYAPYSGASCVSPNRKELAAAVHEPEDDLDRLLNQGDRLRSRLGVEYVLATLGDQGMALIGPDETVRYSTLAQEVFDVSGAGDTVIATLAFAVAAGFDMRRAVDLANSAAGFVVGKLGTYAISRDELLHALEAKDAAHANAPLDADALRALVQAWRVSGVPVHAIAGTFDTLEFGALARSKGDSPEAKLVLLVSAQPGDERAWSRALTLLSVPEVDAVAIAAPDVVEQLHNELVAESRPGSTV